MQVFLSHSHRDRDIADALGKLLSDLFGDRVRVEYSSDQAAGGGIPPGSKWLPWITKRIRGANKTYVLLTPNSMNTPWVLWESGAAAGVLLATQRSGAVVPITFGISDDDIPSPLLDTQRVRGDTSEEGGIHRLLQNLNRALRPRLADATLQSKADERLPDFFAAVKTALQDAAPIESLLASVPHSFSAAQLGGLWVTCYEFASGGATLRHADVSQVTPESERRLRASNGSPAPRTEEHARPFRNRIEAELANRHVIGHWKNLSDTRYFGAMHLSVLTGESVMEGHYTSFASDVSVGSGPWKWVRLDPATLQGVDLSRMVLREPGEIGTLLANHPEDAGPLPLDAVVKPA